MDQAFDAIIHHCERAEFGQARDLGFHKLADFQVIDLGLPGIILQAADGQTDVAFVLVDADDLNLHFLPDFQFIAGMADAVPGDFTQMHQAVRSVDVHESAKIGQ